jgi:hypothetical protein
MGHVPVIEKHWYGIADVILVSYLSEICLLPIELALKLPAELGLSE